MRSFSAKKIANHLSGRKKLVTDSALAARRRIVGGGGGASRPTLIAN